MGNSGHEVIPAHRDDTKQTSDVELGVRKPGSKGEGRKRTKTGCLTCRRRRIKCGEEKPKCQNCHKSKRECEGYNQRVVFKDPLNLYRGPSMSANVLFSEIDSPINPPLIAPKPRSLGLAIVTSDVALDPVIASTSAQETERRKSALPAAPEIHTRSSHITTKTRQVNVNFDTVDRSHIPEPTRNLSSPAQTTHYDFEALNSRRDARDQTLNTPAKTSPSNWPAGSTSSAAFFQSYPTTSTWQKPTPLSASSGRSFQDSSKALLNPVEQFSHIQSSRQKSHDQRWQLDRQIQHPAYVPQADKWPPQHGIADFRQNNHAADDDEEDPYDVSDEEMKEYECAGRSWEEQFQDRELQRNSLGVMVARQAQQEIHDLGVRSITSFIDRPNMLATYTPSSHSSPLNDSMTARLFCHFIHVTGPTMSMFERHPANPSLIFQDQPVSKNQQHIWTYIFPTLAFQNQGLLHAMLALASLHIAKLQDRPITASLKHYAIGLRRVAKSLNAPSRRGQPATLAASMLLAFYECWSADHQKWSNHLLGAKTLIREIDFAGMTKQIKIIKAQQRREEREREYQAQQQSGRGYFEDRTQVQAIAEDVDENIVGMLMGKKIQYDQYGQVLDDDVRDGGPQKTFTSRELDTYEVQRDLFWWYCKQDVYQSMLGGGRLFMDYDMWSHCPPRAPLGRLSATYGTFDHLILLMGRLADFTSKDIKRKRLAMKANGGNRPPGNKAATAPPSSFTISQMPSFNGMVPGVAPPQLPMGYEQTQRDESPQSEDSNSMDLDALRVEAEEEWQDIRNAFSILEDHFGEDFQALGPEFSAPIQTPFGTALQYRTYGIAGIWMNFYMALIACHRAHPSMPPAMMVAAGMAARQTTHYANELGRIAAGIASDSDTTQQVSPGVGAALIQSSTCLFVSGVQYQHAGQRTWTVNRLREIARLTGWQSALACAAGCETSWMKTGELGRGPKYVRTANERIAPAVWTSARGVDKIIEGNVNTERRLVISRSDRIHFALGILGVEEDFETLDLDNAPS